MTAKEKAKELVEKFEDFADYHDCDVFTQIERLKINAKQCALIAVDEILISFNDFEYYPEDLKCYWEAVIKEIERL
jgi:hypothetical protein